MGSESDRVERALYQGARELREITFRKRLPVFRPETLQNNNLGSGFDSIKTGRTLGATNEHHPVSARATVSK